MTSVPLRLVDGYAPPVTVDKCDHRAGRPLAAALRACADGFYPAEAMAELLIGHASRLCRDGLVEIGPRITDGTTLIAEIDWSATIAALDNGGLLCSGASTGCRARGEPGRRHTS